MKERTMHNVHIRPIVPSELPLMEEFQYLAIFQRDTENLLPWDVIYDPAIRIYFEGWGKQNDHCLVAELQGAIVGMVWTRLLNGPIKGFGYTDDTTPEFAISVRRPYRAQGIGTALMQAMLLQLRAAGYKKTSLAVQKDNYAVRMYEQVGFYTIDENEQEYIMVCTL